MLIAASPVLAHASLVRAEPAPGALVLEAPQRVTLWFAEPVEPKFGDIRVLDSDGSRVDKGDSAIYGVDTRAMSVSLQPLGRGVYTVAWRNVSALDGHALRDTFTFAVGQMAPPMASTAGERPPLLPSPLDPFLRWLRLLSALFLEGGLGFGLIVAGPRLSTHSWLAARLATRTNSALWAAAATLTAAEVGLLMVQTSVLYEVPLHKTIGPNLAMVLQDTEWGRVWLLRLVVLWAAVGAAIPGLRGGSADVRTAGSLLAFVLGAVLLATYSLTSHGSAMPGLRLQGTLNDYWHLLAAALWAGGLGHFLWILPVLRALPGEVRLLTLEALVPRFSTVASLSVATLLITGLYSAWATSGTLVLAYTETAYGLVLLAKEALVISLLALGALSFFWVRRRLWQGPAQEWLHKLVLGQVFLAALVLLSVGFLTTLEPARLVAAREGLGREEAKFFYVEEGDKRITMRADPGRLGSNRFRVWVSDRQGNPIDDAEVNLRLAYTGADLGAADVSTNFKGKGEYSVEGVPLGIAGLWRLDLSVHIPGAFDAKTALSLVVTPAAAGSSESYSAGNLFFLAEVLVLGILLLNLLPQ